MMPACRAFLIPSVSGNLLHSTRSDLLECSAQIENMSDNEIPHDDHRPVQNSHRRNISLLNQWAVENKVQLSPSAALSLNSEEDDYGISLNKSSKKYDRILSVPKEVVLDSEYIRREWYAYLEPALDHIHKSGLHDSTLNFVLMAKILYEYNLGKDSRWYMWIESLPKVFNTGVCMDEVELDCLPPFSLALANFERQQLEVFQKAYGMLEDTPIFVKSVSDELCTWAFNVVMTRCWRYAQNSEYNGDDGSLNDDNGNNDMVRPIIVPLGDMFNHKEPPNVMVKDSDLLDSVEFVLAQDIPVPHPSQRKGDQSDSSSIDLFLSYGLTNPHRFLTVFGFCDESMPEVFSQLLFQNPTPELIHLGCNDRSKMVYRTSDGGISTTVWDCILYTLLAQVPSEQQEFYTAHMEGNVEEKMRFHRKYALEEALTLRNHVEATANEFRDYFRKIDFMKEEERALHPRLPLIRRHNHFLYRIFDKVRQRIDQRARNEVKRRKEAKSNTN